VSIEPGGPGYRTRVIEDWIDYNGHLSEAYYVLVFGFATDAFMSRIGLRPAAHEVDGSTLYTVEAHVRYLQEVRLGEELTVSTMIVLADDKRLHLAHEMHAGSHLVATEEVMCLHVAGAPPAVTPFPGPVAARIAAATNAHGPAQIPQWVGASIRRWR